MKILNIIMNSALYKFIFGDEGILSFLFEAISFRSNKCTKRNSAFKPLVDKDEEYKKWNFDSEEFYILFLKEIEEKKRGGDKIEYK